MTPSRSDHDVAAHDRIEVGGQHDARPPSSASSGFADGESDDLAGILVEQDIGHLPEISPLSGYDGLALHGAAWLRHGGDFVGPRRTRHRFVTDDDGVIAERLNVAEADDTAAGEQTAASNHETKYARAAIIEEHIDDGSNVTARDVRNRGQSQQLATRFHIALLCRAIAAALESALQGGCRPPA